MAGESDPDKFAKLAVSSLAKIMDTDICLLVMPPDKKGKLKVQVGFDRSSQRYLSEIDLESRGMPLITSSLRMGRTRRVPAASTSPDLGTLANALNIERTGDILFTPVLNPDGSIVSSVILLSPYSARDWSIQDQSFLTSFAKILVYFLQRSREMATLRLDFNQIKSMARQTQEQMQLTAEERQKLRDQVAVLKEEAQQDKAEIARMALTAAALITAQQTIEQLTSENEQLKEAAQQAAQAASLEEQSDGELRMALQEIAFLRDALAEAEEKVESSMLSPRGEIPSDLQFSEIFSVAQDLRQPLSSIAGYTDFLLSESVGLLGAMQRKYLDRIKVSTERMNRLIDDLIQATHKETSPTQRELTNIDLCSVINKAINETDEQMRDKMIALRVNLPDQALNLVTDPQAIRKVFVSLLRNAGSVSPIGGEVMVNARYETAEGERDYILVQVADSGEGIAPQDLPRVLSQRVDGEEISGISDNGLELSQVKTLVEVLGGRAWVDSEIGHGAIYSVLLPVSSGNSESPLIGRD
jgi:signal transduction histidine kinase